MKKVKFLLGFSLFLMITFSNVFALNDYGTLFILGKSSVGEIVKAGEISKLTIGKNPINLINTGKNQVLLCAGDYSYSKSTKSSKVKEKASLSVYDSSNTKFNTLINFDAAIAGYFINKSKSTLWLFTEKGTYDQEELKATLYRINLNTFEKVEIPLDDDIVKIVMSSDEKWLAVATSGLPDKEGSTVQLLDPTTLTVINKYDVDKNPSIVTFNDNNSVLLIACAGNPANKPPKTSGIWLIDLVNQKVLLNKPLGPAARGFIYVEDNSRYYGVSNADDPGKFVLTAFDVTGVLFETKIGFIPQYIEKRPNSDQVFVLNKENNILVINSETGETIKDITVKYKLSPLNFINNCSEAFIYSVPPSADSNLLSIDLDKLEFKNAIKISGPNKSFRAVFQENISMSILLMMGGVDKALVGSTVADLNNINCQMQYLRTIEATSEMEEMYNQLNGLNIIVSPAQDKVYILNKNTDTIFIYNLAQQKIMQKITGFTGVEHFFLSANQKYMIVITNTEVMLVNTATYRVDYRELVNGAKFLGISGGSVARTINPSFSPDGRKMFVGKIKSALKCLDLIYSVIDLDTGKRVDEIPAKSLYIDFDPSFYW